MSAIVLKVTARLGWLTACGAGIGFLWGCGNLPESYAPPPQRPVLQAPASSARVLAMADADAESYFVQDISPSLEANTWRWTGKRPTVRLFPGSNQKLHYSMDFVIAGTTLQQTGPVTVSFFVNDRLLDREHYTAPGRHKIEKPVPADWVEPDADTTVAAEIDKLWMPPQKDGKPLGFILVALGLEQK